VTGSNFYRNYIRMGLGCRIELEYIKVSSACENAK
jgi:hypothetical protein